MNAQNFWDQVKLETCVITSKTEHRHGVTLQNENELLHVLTRLLDLTPRNNMLEIGFYFGGSFLIWSKLFTKVASIDTNANFFAEFLKERPRYNHENYKFLHGRSQDPAILQAVKSFSPSYDVLFIDGSHVYDDVKVDYEMYSPLIRTGGLIIFHDACHAFPNPPSGVPRYIEELRTARHKIEVFCDTLDPKTPWQNLPFRHMGVGIEKVQRLLFT